MREENRLIVFNSFFDSHWDSEERRSYPLISTRLLRINIKVSKNNYQSTIEECNNKCQQTGWVKTFEHRLNLETIQHITIRGGIFKDLHIFHPTDDHEYERYEEQNEDAEPNEEDDYEEDPNEQFNKEEEEEEEEEPDGDEQYDEQPNEY
ncbi:hypothetical protein B9Z55_015328 [Caenorhabditis nigoni]|nr:hypothetical protein B9Z55_015328 [Caenorhabditis nigoni]